MVPLMQPFKPYVRGVILNAQNEIFLQMRADAPLWEIPGGGVDPHEFFGQAILREVQEETGLLATATTLFGIYHRWAEHDGEICHDAILNCYLCHVDDLSTLTLTNEAVQQKFFAFDKLPTNTHPYYRLMIENVIQFQKDGIMREHDFSNFPRMGQFLESLPFNDLHDFNVWRQHPITLQLFTEDGLHSSCKKFFEN